MKYVSKDNLTQYDSLIKEYIKNRTQDIDDIFSYGITWKVNQVDPHVTRIGNMNYHKTLPIQSNMRGCVVQFKSGKPSVQYYLNPNDWRFMPSDKVVTITSYTRTGNTITNTTYFSDHKYEYSWIKYFNSDNSSYTEMWIGSIDISTGTATLYADEDKNTIDDSVWLSTNPKIELGTSLNGFDGQVMVEVPEFWIKSKQTDTDNEVRIYTAPVVENLTHQKKCYIAAYHMTTLQSAVTNWGYLSTFTSFPVGLSIKNYSTACRGGNRNTSYENTNRYRCTLGKPATSYNRTQAREYCRRSNIENINYVQYKNILVWLWVIEYANRYSQETFNSSLTSEGYHQGGMGNGVSNVGNWDKLNGNNPCITNGFTDSLGNNSGYITATIPAFDYTKYSIWFNSMATNGNVVVSSNGSNNSKVVTQVKAVTNYAFYHNPDNVWGTTTYVISGLTDGQSVYFREGSVFTTANTVLEVTEDGTYDVAWQDYNTGGQKWVSFGKTQTSCNITIYNSKQNTATVTQNSQSVQVPRWRGIEQPFGDIWNIIEGVAFVMENGKKNMYYTTDPDKYVDSNFSTNMEFHGEIPQTSYWISEIDLQESAEIIPKSACNSSNTYYTDYIWGNDSSNCGLIVGACAWHGAPGGLFAFFSYDGVGSSWSDSSFRPFYELS